MPTRKNRYPVLETEAIRRALTDAAHVWPRLSNSQLLAKLALEGHRALRTRRENREAAIRRSAGAFTAAYGADYLTELREDWPE